MQGGDIEMETDGRDMRMYAKHNQPMNGGERMKKQQTIEREREKGNKRNYAFDANYCLLLVVLILTP